MARQPTCSASKNPMWLTTFDPSKIQILTPFHKILCISQCWLQFGIIHCYWFWLYPKLETYTRDILNLPTFFGNDSHTFGCSFIIQCSDSECNVLTKQGTWRMAGTHLALPYTLCTYMCVWLNQYGVFDIRYDCFKIRIFVRGNHWCVNSEDYQEIDSYS